MNQASTGTTRRLPEAAPRTGYASFLRTALRLATDGGFRFYAWMIILSGIFLVGLHTWAEQVRDGMIHTHMTDHVSWGLYIANFTFMVGLAAGAVMMVIPAYLYHDEKMHDVVIIGEILAVGAILMSLGFVVVDLGRPDRFWHLIPGIGRFNWPVSMLTWDVIVLNGYLLINMHVVGYLLYKAWRGERPIGKWYLPFVYLGVFWAVSIHAVTAFLYCGLGGRPFWNTALMVPRFLASAFVSGPAFIIVALAYMRRFGIVSDVGGPIRTLTNVMRVTILVSLLMLVSEIFVEFYTGGAHTASARYLYFGLHGHDALVPWIWSAIAMLLVATGLLFIRRVHDKTGWLVLACVLAFVAVWIEKGMGLIIPAFVPSTLHEVVEYTPSLLEWKVTAGIWAFGLMVFTVGAKIALPILSGRERAPAEASE